MLQRLAYGRIPEKHHTVLRDDEGRLLYEECITRDGFEGPYTLLYHRARPQAVHEGTASEAAPALSGHIPDKLARRHYRSLSTPAGKGPFASRLPLLFNDDLVIGVAQPTAADQTYVSNGDGDELIFVFEGAGIVRSILGDLRYEKNDYLLLPRGIIYRMVPDEGVPQRWFTMEFRRGVGIPSQWRTPVGQLRMDAPYCHLDFRVPEFKGPMDEGIRGLTVKKSDRFHAFKFDGPPLDVIGWDGGVYPIAFPILKFQPRVGLVHLPPTWHGTFAGSGALVCSFVPRPVDFHPQAIPCPYPHSNVDVDEVIFYCSGNFTSRRGVGPGSVSFHPAGVAHGPHPQAYEKSIGAKSTEELAVMLDCYKPLKPTEYALAVEDPAYQESFGD